MHSYRKCILLVVFAVLLFFAGKQVGEGAWFATRALYSFVVSSVLGSYQAIKRPYDYFVNRWRYTTNLEDKLQQLRMAYDTLLAKHISFVATHEYAEETEHLVAFKQRYNLPSAIQTHVILRSFSDHGHFYLVNAGSYHGVEDQMVAFLNNCLIGRVTTIHPFYSVVTLITDRSCKVAAYCAETKTKGIHEGLNNDYATLSFIDPLAVTKQDDLVISTGQGMVFPQGFLLGMIDILENDDQIEGIKIKPALQLREIDYCLLASRHELEIIFK